MNWLRAGLFEQAVALDTRAEEGYFAYAKYLDQHMRDARERQERLKDARKRAAEEAARARAAAVAAGEEYHLDLNAKIDRLNNKARHVQLPVACFLSGHQLSGDWPVRGSMCMSPIAATCT